MKEMYVMKNRYSYRMGNKIYINLTNRCSNACTFCVRTNGSMDDYELWLDKEPSVQDVIASLPPEFAACEEVVFCGFGEPLYRLDAMVELGAYFHRCGKRVRLNTNGQAKHICGEDAAKSLAGNVDIVNVSLNAADALRYQEICRCEFGTEGFDDMLNFAADCKRQGISVVFSVVDVIGEEQVARAKRLAEQMGIPLRVRAYIG